MKLDAFKIFVDRLVEGSCETLDFSASADLMDVKESELVFSTPICVKGQAYVADQNLCLHLSVSTVAHLPCLVCNQLTAIPLEILKYVHTESVEEIKGKVYDFLPVIREALLLELPLTVECREGSCPERGKLEKYFSKAKGEYSPFKDL